MEWPKLKNIILIMLAIVNLFLAVLMAAQEGRAAQLARQARDNTVRILEKRGIFVDADALPKDANLRQTQMERDREGERSMAEALLGEATEENQGGVSFYTGAAGVLRVSGSGSEFSATLNKGALPLNGKEPEAHARELLERMGFSALALETSQERGAAVVRVVQLWQGVPVFTCQAVLRYEGGDLRSIAEGSRRLPGKPGGAQGGRMMTGVTALLRFLEGLTALGDVSTGRITKITAGYMLSAGLTGPAQMVPAWFFSTDARDYCLNGITGELSRTD